MWRAAYSVCRSPDPLGPGARASVGGWGLGIGHEDSSKDKEEEDEQLDWDQAQVRLCLQHNAKSHPLAGRR